eukprot:TRINITY_DN14462_c0_g2_i3.p3 TRINITY_DN14462_c0_g2~~TRINITY_DN14462_c0_g2_i3.p3  ORF type:complete len:115 (-),score=25.44 TRINITY_DN14462_c0_g2_i3:616-960(-)
MCIRDRKQRIGILSGQSDSPVRFVEEDKGETSVEEAHPTPAESEKEKKEELVKVREEASKPGTERQGTAEDEKTETTDIEANAFALALRRTASSSTRGFLYFLLVSFAECAIDG